MDSAQLTMDSDSTLVSLNYFIDKNGLNADYQGDFGVHFLAGKQTGEFSRGVNCRPRGHANAYR